VHIPGAVDVTTSVASIKPSTTTTILLCPELALCGAAGPKLGHFLYREIIARRTGPAFRAVTCQLSLQFDVECLINVDAITGCRSFKCRVVLLRTIREHIARIRAIGSWSLNSKNVFKSGDDRTSRMQPPLP